MSNRGRFQAQGDNLEKSEDWSQDNVPTKIESGGLLTTLSGRLTRRELEVRDVAFAKAMDFVNRAPENGYQSQVIKTYNNPNQRKSIRVDVEIRAGWAFKNDD
jgi:hypothetical protein